MTATNGIRTENKMKRLAAAIGVALAAMLAAASLSPARADAAGTSDGNLVIDVPTTVPCALMADGTVVSPSEWNITTSGDAYIASASASGFPANVEWSAKTTDLASTQAGSVQVSGAGDAATVTGPSDPASAKLAPSAGFEWAFSKLDADKNNDIIGKATSGTAVLGSVTFTFAKVEPDAFAVYSADDNSLSFYKRAGVPVAGQTFEGKTATEVYTGIETMTSIPGWTQNHFNDIKTVTVYDEGIAPTGTAFWFAGVRNLKTADISKLDMSRCKTIECMFTDCISLETLDLSGWDTSSLTNMSQAFHHCASLTKLNVSGWDVSKVTNMQLAFAEDKALGSLDLSTWDNSAITSMKDAFLQMDSLNKISLGSKFKFVGSNGYLPTPSSTYIAGADGKWYDTDGNGYAPANIPSNKAMTYTAVAPKKAFAVYSADDNSLSFYKRSSVPTAGDAFEGKTATEVYEGVEEASYTAADGAPWAGNAAEIASVTVEDDGVAPVSTAYWFKGASKLKSVSLAALDTAQTTCMDGMFDGCSSLESLDLSSMSTRRVASMSAFLGGCDSLAELSIGSEFAWVDDDCYPPTGNWKQESTGNDYSESDIPANKTDKYTRTKTAFAVYSEDDQSLTFYKRAVPTEGAQFLGKAVTKICTGFETETYGSGDNVPWSPYTSSIKTVTVADDGIAPASTAYWFYYFSNVNSIDLAKLDTSGTTNMSHMFESCKSSSPLPLKWLDTSKATNLSYMFSAARGFDSAALSALDTSSAEDMSHMFEYCTTIQSLSLKGFDTSKATDISSMFENCWSLESVDVSSFDTRNVANMHGLFYKCKALKTLDITSFDASNVEDASCMFVDCGNLSSLDMSHFNISKCGQLYRMFDGCSSLKELDLRSFNNLNLEGGEYDTMDNMFDGCSSLEKVSFSENFVWIWIMDSSLPSPNASNIPGADGNWYAESDGIGYAPTAIPSKKADTYYASKDLLPKAFAVFSADDGSLNFYKRAGVPSAGDQFERKTVTAVYTGIETDGFTPKWTAEHGSDLGSVTVTDEGIAPKSTASWFKECRNLVSSEVAKLDMSKCKDISYMFSGCDRLMSLDLSSWDTSSLENISYMLESCLSLKEINVSCWDVSNVTNMENAFSVCRMVRKLDLSTWNNAKTSDMTNMFAGMTQLEEVKLGNGFRWVGSNPYLPTPSDDCIADADGKWHAQSDNRSYEPNEIPVGKADVYFAHPAIAPSPIVTVTGETKTGSTLTATVQGLPAGENTVSYEWQTIKKEDYDNGGRVWGSVDHLDPKSATLATDSSYDGEYVRCKVTVRNDDYFVEPGYSNVLGPMTTPKTAFAVYSATDGSLSFYNRAEVPKQGSMFLGRKATAVYTGFETKTSIPGWMLNYSSSIKTVTVYDEGIAPIGTGHWFAELRNMKTADVSKLDMSRCKTISCMFTDCTSLETLDLSAWDTRSLTSMSQAFQNCTSLTKLDVSGWDVSKVTDMDLAFAEDRALSSLDLSTWNNSAATTMKDVFSMMDSLNEVSLGSKFKFTGTRPFLPEQTGHVTGFDGKWYAKSTGIGYAPADVPSYKAETYYATKALRDAAVGVASNPVDDDSTAVPAATSTCKAQGESTTQKDAMGKQQLVEIASKGSDAASEPEGAEKAAVKKSGE